MATPWCNGSISVMMLKWRTSDSRALCPSPTNSFLKKGLFYSVKRENRFSSWICNWCWKLNIKDLIPIFCTKVRTLQEMSGSCWSILHQFCYSSHVNIGSCGYAEHNPLIGLSLPHPLNQGLWWGRGKSQLRKVGVFQTMGIPSMGFASGIHSLYINLAMQREQNLSSSV